MSQVDYIDWVNKRVYLHIDTVLLGFDVIAAHKEIKKIISINANNEQNYLPIMSAEGNIQKTFDTYTARFGLINEGWRFVPYDTGTRYSLELLVEVISKEQITDANVFERGNLGGNVDIDAVYDPVEIREVVVQGSGPWDLLVSEHDGAGSFGEMLQLIHKYWIADEIKTPTLYRRVDPTNSEVLIEKNYTSDAAGNESLTD